MTRRAVPVRDNSDDSGSSSTPAEAPAWLHKVIYHNFIGLNSV